jgi:heterodisulfide reductase subunit A
MFALKEAAVARTVAGNDFEATIIYMDMRTFGKSFERYGQQAVSPEGVPGTGPVHSIAPTPGSDDVGHPLDIRVGRNPRETFRSGGAFRRPAGQPATAVLAELDWASSTDPIRLRQNQSPFPTPAPNGPGSMPAEPLTGPTDIAESVIRASSAAVNASRTIHHAGGGLAEKTPCSDVFRDVSRERPRILVVLCRCDIQRQPETDNAAGTLSAIEQDPAVVRVDDFRTHLHGRRLGCA